MQQTGYNIILHQKRLDLGLSLNQAASKLHVFVLFLLLYEKGYLIVPKKYYQRFIDLYQLDENFFSDNLLYPKPLKEHKVKPLNPKVVKFFSRPWIKIVSLVLAIIGFILIPGGNHVINDANNNVPSFFSQEFNQVRNIVVKKGVVHSEPSSIQYYDLSDNDPSTNHTVGMIFYDNAQLMKSTRFYAVSTNESGDTYNTYYTYSYKGIQITITQGKNFATSMAYDGGKFSINYVLDYASANYLDDQSPDYYYYIGDSLKQIEKDFKAFNAMLIKYQSPLTFEQTCLALKNGDRAYENRFAAGNALMIGGGLVGSFFAVLLAFLFITKKVNAAEERSANDIASMENNSSHSSTCKNERKLAMKQLKPNFSFPFILPETFLRIGILIIIFLASIGNYLIFAKFFNVLTLSSPTSLSPFFFTEVNALLNFRKISGSILCIGIILHMFLKTDSLIATKTYLRTAIIFLGLGAVYYVTETVVVCSTQLGLTKLAALIKSFKDVLPGNILWGIASYSLIMLFLFSTPQKIQNNAKKVMWWRLLAIVPIVYLIFSDIYSILIKTGSMEPFPYYVSFLLYSKRFAINSFVILFIAFIYFFRRYIYTRYGKEQANIYFEGNRYVFVKNSIATFLIILLGSIELAVKYTPASSNNIAIALGLGNSYLLMIAAPFAMFYSPHRGERNKKVDQGYSLLYAMSYGISFILIGINLIPYITYLDPILQTLLQNV